MHLRISLVIVTLTGLMSIILVNFKGLMLWGVLRHDIECVLFLKLSVELFDFLVQNILLLFHHIEI